MTNYCALPSGTLKNTQDLGSIPLGHVTTPRPSA
uniref:Uncharacterized protein n=1 Tax=Anguilla anguilla TaxID=7936 RepID=A0A0E9PB39_ANGAN